MTKYEIYNIVNGVFLTFSKNLSKKLLCISHSREVIDKKISLFPSSTSLSKPDFIILTVFLMYKYNPSSVFSLCQKFTEYDYNEFLTFKESIKHSKVIVARDIKYLSEKYTYPTLSEIFAELRDKKISFISFYFLKEVLNLDCNSIVIKITFDKIKNIFKFLNYTDETMNLIKKSIFTLKGEKLF